MSPSKTMFDVLQFLLFLAALVAALYSILSRQRETVSGGAHIPAKLMRIPGGFEFHPGQDVDWTDTRWAKLSGKQKAARWFSVFALAAALFLALMKDDFSFLYLIGYVVIVGVAWLFKMTDFLGWLIPFIGPGVVAGIIFYLANHKLLAGNLALPLIFLGPPLGAVIVMYLIDRKTKILKIFLPSVILNVVGSLLVSLVINDIQGLAAWATVTIASGIGALFGEAWS